MDSGYRAATTEISVCQGSGIKPDLLSTPAEKKGPPKRAQVGHSVLKPSKAVSPAREASAVGADGLKDTVTPPAVRADRNRPHTAAVGVAHATLHGAT